VEVVWMNEPASPPAPSRLIRRQSPVGIASLALAVGVGLLELWVLVFVGLARRPLSGAGEEGIAVLLPFFTILFALFLHVLGAALGIGSLFDAGRSSVIGVIGIVLNLSAALAVTLLVLAAG
jgi:hypothetical protein